MGVQLLQAFERALERRLRRILRFVVIRQYPKGAGVHTVHMPADEFAKGFPVVTLSACDQGPVTGLREVSCHMHVRRRPAGGKSAN